LNGIRKQEEKEKGRWGGGKKKTLQESFRLISPVQNENGTKPPNYTPGETNTKGQKEQKQTSDPNQTTTNLVYKWAHRWLKKITSYLKNRGRKKKNSG